MTSPNTQLALNYLHQLAAMKESPPTDTILQQFANYFDASGIGVSCLGSALAETARFLRESKAPATFPWQNDPGLGQRSRCQLAGLAHHDSSGAWLLSLAREPHNGEEVWVWLYRPGQDDWKEAEAALWPLVAQMLVRLLAQHSALISPATCLRHKLEQVALVTSRLSHDFGNYLTGILGFTELSLAQVPAEGLLHRYLQEVLQSARQGSDWIRRLHWFCRRNGAYSWPTELSSVLDDAQARALPGPHPRWEKKIPHDLPLLGIDAASLQAALAEVANNAGEATHGKGTLRITARSTELTAADCRMLLGTAQPGKFVEITLSDDGPGISAEVRAKLFCEPFFSTKPRHRGLGFLVVYGILHRFHGGVRLDDAGESKGASVRLYLPAVPVESATSTEQQAPHLLVVHPDPLLFESLRKILEWQGYRVTVALTAQAALSIYQTPGQSFALVLAEAMLPQLSGFDLARRILDRDARANFMFLYTQSSFHGLAEEEMLKRFTLLRWPLDTPAFVQAVRAALARKSSPADSGKPLHGLR